MIVHKWSFQTDEEYIESLKRDISRLECRVSSNYPDTIDKKLKEKLREHETNILTQCREQLESYK